MIERFFMGAAFVLLAATAAALAQTTSDVLVVQKNREFSVGELNIIAGSDLVFSNLDDFPHQISVKGPGVLTSSGLQRTGEVLRIAVPEPGDFQVRCGIHPRMRLAVHAR